jgi:hypothetical protein
MTLSQRSWENKIGVVLEEPLAPIFGQAVVRVTEQIKLQCNYQSFAACFVV